ncbi:MAG: tetratricopeptide repeat protein [Cytophagales bacterium]
MNSNEYYHLEEMFAEADKLISNGQIAEGAEMLENILAADHTFGKAYNHLGWLNETKFKKYDKAEENYKLCLKYAEFYPAIYYNYGYLLSTLKRFDELEDLLNKALKVDGIDFYTIYHEFAIMRETQGKFDEAIHFFNLCVSFCYNNQTLDGIQENIDRCNKKKSMLKNTGFNFFNWIKNKK